MKTPILWAHDPFNPIGSVEQHNDELRFHFNTGVRISEEALHEIFGNAGIQVTDMEVLDDGTRLIKAGTIVEFSLGTR